MSFEVSTSSIKIVRDGKLSLEEKNAVAVDDSNNIIAFGNAVDTAKHDTIINPLKHGAIADFYFLEQLLRHLIKKSLGKSPKSIFMPSLTTLCLIPDSLTEIEIRGIRDVLEHSGSRNTYMIYSSMALKQGIAIDTNDAFLLLDAGTGKIAFTSITDKQIHSASRLHFGLNKIQEVISFNIRKSYSINCNEETVNDIIYNYLNLNGAPKVEILRIDGTDAHAANISCEIDILQLNESIQPYFQLIIHEVQLVLEKQNDKSSNTVKHIYLVGKLSSVNGFATKLSELTELNIIDKSNADYALKGLLELDADFETNEYALR